MTQRTHAQSEIEIPWEREKIHSIREKSIPKTSSAPTNLPFLKAVCMITLCPQIIYIRCYF